jgi:protocatechuate 3,4-dioxygenase alpha subunit
VTTPSQTVGPYLAIGLPFEQGPYVVAKDTPGAIRIHGHVFDGAGDPITDAMIETWQAGPDGRFGTDFRGFGRAPTGADGEYEIFTLKPGKVDERQAPHIDVSVFARGMLNRCVTRIYFADEANEGDPVLDSVPEDRRGTIIAEPGEDGYRFDVHVQGESETVFFRV